VLCRGSGGFIVQERGSLSLTNIALDPSATIDLSGGGLLSLASVIVPGVGVFDGSNVPEPLQSTADLVGWFFVTSGCSGRYCDPETGTSPCTVSEGGRCVGRPEGYGPSEECTITVGGSGGVLGPCAVFDTNPGPDYVTLPDSDTSGYNGEATHAGSDCPFGAALAPGDAITWHSNKDSQGSVGRNGEANDCTAKGTCGRSWSYDGLGGGWQLCFA